MGAAKHQPLSQPASDPKKGKMVKARDPKKRKMGVPKRKNGGGGFLHDSFSMFLIPQKVFLTKAVMRTPTFQEAFLETNENLLHEGSWD